MIGCDVAAGTVYRAIASNGLPLWRYVTFGVCRRGTDTARGFTNTRYRRLMSLVQWVT